MAHETGLASAKKPGVTRNADGSVDVEIDGAQPTRKKPSKFDENLAELIDERELSRISDELLEQVKEDKQSREGHFQRLKKGMELIGITDMPDTEAPFEGAATVSHPLIAEAMVQFQARAVSEVFPASGPVKTMVLGEAEQEVRDQADRVRDYMNYQLTEEDKDYFWHTDKLLMYLPMSGSAFKKVFIDRLTTKPVARFVKSEDFIVPYAAQSLESAPRYCHVYPISIGDVKRTMQSGYFRDVDLDPISASASSLVEESDELTDLSDDRQATMDVDNPIRKICEIHADYDLSDLVSGKMDNADYDLPYVFSIDEETGKILSIYRNWKEDDELKRKRVWFIHYQYIPGTGFYAWGLIHIIGALGKAASGALRALLDAGARANMQGGFRSKEARNAAGDYDIEPGVYKEVDLPAEDLQNAFFTIPTKEPSPALFNLLNVLIEGGRRFASTTETMVGDAPNTGPVGTTMALIEQGTKVHTAIHTRLHKSAREEFKLIATLNHEYLSEEPYPYKLHGVDRDIKSSDFDDRIDVVPVSDPSISSSAQRIAMSQAVLELVSANPDVYDARAKSLAHRGMLKALNVPDVDAILPDKKTKRLDPVSENQMMLVGQPVKAFYEQDHDSHIAVHQEFLQNLEGMGVEEAKQLTPVFLAHMAEHFGMAYRQTIEQQLGMPLPPLDTEYPDENEELPPELENQVAQAVAQTIPPPEEKPSPEEQQAMEEEQRKQMAFMSEEERKQIAFEREQERKDIELQAELKRDMAKAVQDMRKRAADGKRGKS